MGLGATLFRHGRRARRLGAVALLGVVHAVALAVGAAPARGAGADEGRELFFREWAPNDDRSHGGDGLGPVYNDSSCVACHNAGGAGGGGPSSKNVDIITAVHNNNQVQVVNTVERPGFLRRALGSLVGIDEPKAPPPPQPRKVDTRELIKAHPGFRTARSVVIHKFGNGSDYQSWRDGLMGFSQFNPGQPFGVGNRAARAQAERNRIQMMIQFRQNQIQGQAGEFALLHSQRNPTALFGDGLIDSIPDSALEDAARAKHPDFPEVAGRVSRQKDGRIGRFGWKAQTPTLKDFVLTACAVELGLEVPDHHQGGLPQKPDETAKGLDLDKGECAALVAFVRDLPKPAELKPRGEAQRKTIATGRELFARAGCADCHTPDLGKVEGIYSDLLLHDMGPTLGDVGQYGVFDPNSSEPEFVDPDQPAADAPAGAVAQSLPDLTPPAEERPVAEAAPAPVVAPEVNVIETRAVVPNPDDAKFGVTTTVNTQVVDVQPAPTLPTAPTAFAVPVTPGGTMKRPTTGPASRQEWRTPPLWGFRDSGPYLHDGRAENLEQAVALHGGEAERSAHQFFLLTAEERLQVETFLKSLVAPDGALATAAR